MYKSSCYWRVLGIGEKVKKSLSAVTRTKENAFDESASDRPIESSSPSSQIFLQKANFEKVTLFELVEYLKVN